MAVPEWRLIPMPAHRPPIAGLARALILGLAIAGLAACAKGELPTGEPSLYRNLAQPGAELDAAAAASMLSGYRQNAGLGPVTLDPELMRMADQQARAMVARDRLSHQAGGPFTARLRKAGYHSKTAAENVSAGYYTLAEAFSGWRDSKPHRDNMLLKGATRMGIAAIYSPNSKYKVFWTLILVEPAGESRG
jgi:uncharacterized protein YkwD